MLVGYLPDRVVWWLFQQSYTCWSSVWFLTSQMNLLFSVWIHSVENQKLLKSMVLCPGFVIKSPSPAVPPDSPAHTVSMVNIFWSAPFFYYFFSEIQNVDVLYFLWPVVQWEKKMNVKSVSESPLYEFLWQREGRGCEILLYSNGKHSFNVTWYYWYCIYWSNSNEMVTSWY